MKKIAVNASLSLVSDDGQKIDCFNESELLVININGRSLPRLPFKTLIWLRKISQKQNILAHPISFRHNSKEFYYLEFSKGRIKDLTTVLKILMKSLF
ncbi:MAG: hypothetical protein AAF519_00745 [Bacteroidota bacterium]